MASTSTDESVKEQSSPAGNPTSKLPICDETKSSENGRTKEEDGSEADEAEDGSDEEDGDDNDEEDEDDGDDDDEDKGNSKGPVAGDLTSDLTDAFSSNTDLKGRFSFASKLADAPNPGLAIAPLGPIGLPLSERDAQSIKGIAAQAPFGHGDRLVVDTNVRHTWEIEPEDRITFMNPAWVPFVDTVARIACTELGVLPSSKPPKCELYKLLLYEVGSHFPPHQDTEKAPGMFATIVIVLPSFYTGGQVHVSHGSEKQVFDFSSDGFATSMFTWYADVVHEVKPITSGYRLALSYNLIQQETSFPLPSAPSATPVIDRFRGIFQKWSKKGYASAPRQIAYVLDHKYSQVDLGLGEKALKGHDAQRVRILRRVAEEHGVAIGLAELECHVVGYTDDDFGYGGYHKRMRCYYDEYSDDDGGMPSMGEEEERTTKISSLVDLDGNQLLDKGEIVLDTEELIPEDPFSGEEPDDQDYEGYQGNAPGSVEYWYHRVVILLYLKADAHCLLLRAGGVKYAISQLKLRDSSQPTSADRDFANYVVERLDSYSVQRSVGNERDTTAYMLALALRWKDADMWLKIAYKIGVDGNMSLIGEGSLTTALELFGFDKLRPLFEKAIAGCRSLKDQMEIINRTSSRVKAENDKPGVSAWCDQQRALALGSLKTPIKDDVPIYISVLKSNGLQYFAGSIQPQLVRCHSIFQFLMAFVRALHEEREAFLDTSSGELVYRQTIESCLTLAARQWKVPESTFDSYYSQPAKQQASPSSVRIKEFIEVCFLTEQTSACRTLFESLIRDTAEAGVKFKNYFLPLVPVLRRLLNSHNTPFNDHPFGDFFRYLIETFLCSMLGPKKGKMRHHAVKKVGCGCTYCQELDTFLFSTLDKKYFRIRQKERTHLEQRLINATSVVKVETMRHGSPYTLAVTKHADIVAAQSWEGRQKAAKSFLVSLGGDAAIKLIMGTRYPDVLKALSGEQAYTNIAKPYSSSAPSTSVPAREVQTTTAQDTGSSSEAVSRSQIVPATEPNAPASSSISAGTKRKSLGFIDLSGLP